MNEIFSALVSFVALVIVGAVSCFFGSNLYHNRKGTRDIESSYRDSEKRIDTIASGLDEIERTNQSAEAGIGNAQKRLDDAKALLDKIRKGKQ